MKKILYPVIEILLTVLLILSISSILFKIMQEKQSVRKYREFYAASGEYDVLFFGSSHMMQTALPLEIWKKYGIRSYNMGNGTENIAVSYQVIKNTLDYCTPRVIMLDVYNSFDDQKIRKEVENMPHQFFDMVRHDSPHKTESIYEMFPDNERLRWNYLFDFSIYHSRWNELSKGDFYLRDDGLGGARFSLGSFSPRNPDNGPPDTVEMSPEAKEYLHKIKDLCEEREIRLVCVVNPYPAWFEMSNEGFIKAVQEQSIERAGMKFQDVDFEPAMKELGLEFIDLRDTDIIDKYADGFDFAHINLCGARKISDFYGRFLKETGLKLETPQTSEKLWENRYRTYIMRKADMFKECDDCAAMLSDLNDPDFIFDISLRSDPNLSTTMKHMLDNAAGYENVSIKTDDSIDSSIRIRISEKESGTRILDRLFDL